MSRCRSRDLDPGLPWGRQHQRLCLTRIRVSADESPALAGKVSAPARRCSGSLTVATTAFRESLAERGAVGIDCRLSPFHEDTVLRGAVGHAIDAGWERLIEQAGPQASMAATELS